MVYSPVSVCPSVCASSLDNSSYSFHQIVLKLGEQLDNEVVQGILFQGYSTPNFDSYYCFFFFFTVFETWLLFWITPTIFIRLG